MAVTPIAYFCTRCHSPRVPVSKPASKAGHTEVRSETDWTIHGSKRIVPPGSALTFFPVNLSVDSQLVLSRTDAVESFGWSVSRYPAHGGVT